MKSGFAHVPKPWTTSFKPATGKMLQRKCACGGTLVAGDECAKGRKKRLQPKLIVNQPGDHFEQEVDEMAEFVVRGGARAPTVSNDSLGELQREAQKALLKKEDLRLLGKAPSKSSAPASRVPPIALEVLGNLGQPLDSSTRAFMERRFGHDFGNVRVNLDARAAASARSVNALAYTVGHNIVFSAGAFAPEDPSGRRLLAHELAHVVQQSDARTARGQLLQRQPDETSTKESPPTKTAPTKTAPAETPPHKTLKSEGVDLNDPVASKTAGIVDAVLARSRKLAPYIGDKIKAGFKIAEKGKFVQDTSDGNFDDAYRDAYDLSSGDTVPKSTKGFLDTKKSEIHLRPDALFGTALHEAVHRLASPRLYSQFLPIANKISSTLTEVLKEGVTAFFTDEILKEEELPNFNDAYRSKKDKAKNLIDALKPDGFDMIGNFNFKGSGIVEIGEKLGLTREQYAAAKGDGIKEVLKRMEKML